MYNNNFCFGLLRTACVLVALMYLNSPVVVKRELSFPHCQILNFDAPSFSFLMMLHSGAMGAISNTLPFFHRSRVATLAAGNVTVLFHGNISISSQDKCFLLRGRGVLWAESAVYLVLIYWQRCYTQTSMLLQQDNHQLTWRWPGTTSLFQLHWSGKER